MVVRWEGGMVLVVQVIVGVWAAWVGWGRGEVVVVVVAPLPRSPHFYFDCGTPHPGREDIDRLEIPLKIVLAP